MRTQNKSLVTVTCNQNLIRTDQKEYNDFDRTAKYFTPTQTLTNELQGCLTYYNRILFKGELSDCMLRLDQSGRTRLGYFKPLGYVSKDGHLIHEIAISASHILDTDIKNVLSTLAHEMCHMARWDLFAKKTYGSYHCKKWVAIMEGVGLIPSDTGKPQGKKTGHRVSHYIQPDGPFDRASDELIQGRFSFTWGQASEQLREAAIAKVTGKDTIKDNTNSKDKSKGKVKFICPICQRPAWFAPPYSFKCTEHDVPLIRGDQ